jgi:hypothetical protein
LSVHSKYISITSVDITPHRITTYLGNQSTLLSVVGSVFNCLSTLSTSALPLSTPLPIKSPSIVLCADLDLLIYMFVLTGLDPIIFGLIGAMAILLTAILPWFDLDAQCSMLD